jgi:hypothetical protein
MILLVLASVFAIQNTAAEADAMVLWLNTKCYKS